MELQNQVADSKSFPDHHLPYRRDIDGLRGIAIALVVIFHAFPSVLPNGFLGVDVFFVISGFLITSLILKQQGEGSFSLLNFFKRRIRRLAPAATVVFLITTLVATFTLFDAELQLFFRSLKAALFYYLNYQLIFEAGYFDISVNLKPLMHFWSLNVEEQFYFIWPAALILIWNSFKTSSYKFLYRLNSLIIALSFYYFVTNYSEYYSLQARAWELLAGAQLAVAFRGKLFETAVTAIRQRYPHAFVCVGMFFITLSQILSSRQTASVFAVLGTAALLFPPASNGLVKSYSNNFFVGLGKISYSLYLWHWPVLSFLRIYTGNHLGLIGTSSAVLASLIMAILSYFYIEQVFLNRKWSVWFYFGAASTVLAVYFICTLKPENLEFYKEKRHIEIHADQANLQKNCMLADTNVPWCVTEASHGRKSFKSLVIGDSHAHSQFTGLTSVFPEVEWSLVANHSCDPFIAGDPQSESCQKDFAKAIEIFRKDNRFEWLVLVSANRVFVDQKDRIVAGENISKLSKVFSDLLANGKKIILMSPVPEISDDIYGCLLKRPFVHQFLNHSEFCEISEANWQAKVKENKEFLKVLKAENPRLTIVNPESLICDGKKCSILLNGKSLYADKDHLSEYGSERVAELLKTTLKNQ
jgi:peptidoglycan/LPS O-acetylase OafA/YrhL